MRRAAVVVNPIKVKNLRALREQLTTVFRGYGWAPPLWSVTTADDPGTNQTRAALGHGVDLVVALGGDGTVRMVAEALLWTGMPLAVLGGGTGNLFARQLKLPVRRYPDALRIGLSGVDTPVDTIRISLDTHGFGEFTNHHTGLVMSGIGRDADVMTDTTAKLKSRLGWAAYLVAGMHQVRHDLVTARIRLDDQPEFTREVTTVLAGNCGVLQGGLRMMPDAVVDDGLLDALVLRGGGLHWVPLLSKLAVRSRTDSPQMTRAQFAEMTVSVDVPQQIQVDGDVIGSAHAARFRAEHGSLTVRLPRS